MGKEEPIDWQLKLAQLKDNQKQIREFMEIMLKEYSIYARQYKTYFDSLIEAGFTEGQAMDIIKAHGWLPK